MNLPVLHRQAAPPGVGDAHAHAGVLHGAGYTHIFCLVKVGLHRLQRLHQSGLRAYDLPVGQGLSGADSVAVSDLPGGDAHQVRHLIEHSLQPETGLGDAEAPESSSRWIVGVVGVAVDLEILVVVGARRVGTGPLQHRPAQGGVGSGVGNDVGGYALDDAVLVTAHGELHLHGVPLGMDEDAFRTGEPAFYRTLGEIGHQGGVVLDGDVLLAAEAAAHQQVLHLHLLHRQAQHGGSLVLGIVGALVRGENHHAVPVRVSYGALRFQKGMLRVWRIELPGQHMLAFGDGKCGVAPLDVLVGHEVAALVNQGRIRQHGLLGRADGLQHLVVHLHQFLGLLQNLLGLGGNDADGVSQIVGGAAHGDHGVPVLHQMAHLVLPGDICGGEHAHHPRKGLGLLRADGLHQGPGMGGADGGGADHALHIYIVGINPGALDLLRHVDAVDPAAQLPGPALLLIGDASLPEDLGRQAHALDDLHVSGTPADVGPQGEPDLLHSGVRADVQQALGRHDHAGDAEAALNGPRFAEAIGVGLLLKIAEALHGENAFALHLIRRKDAGSCSLAVHQDGAGAAGALAAPVLHTGQAQLVPQEADELLIFFGSDGFPVHNKCSHCGSPSVVLPPSRRCGVYVDSPSIQETLGGFNRVLPESSRCVVLFSDHPQQKAPGTRAGVPGA